MPKKNIEIKTYTSESGGKIFVLSQSIKGLNEYQKAKTISQFINSETKVLEMAIETYLREILRDNGILPIDGSKSSLERAFITLENDGKRIEITDRYSNGAYTETIVGESNNNMTVIIEDDILSCAIEIEVITNGW